MALRFIDFSILGVIMRRIILVSALALVFCVSDATAQTTSTCMGIGGGMVHCDHLGGGWTDCNSVGDSIATCQTMGVPDGRQVQSSDGGEALGRGIGSLISSIRERSFRKKVGGMLAAGDCDSAAKYAFEKGRIELGSEIQRNCRPGAYTYASPNVGAAAMPLPQALHQMAIRAPTPAALDPNTTITKIQAEGSQLTFSVTVKDKAQFTDQWRSSIVHELCEPDGFGRLLKQGAIVRSEFEDQQRRSLGVMTVTATQCQ